MRYSYTESGYEKMVEAAERGRQTRSALCERARLDYLANPKRCPVCNQAISYENREANTYCGSSCAAKVSNTKRRKTTSCEGCGKLIQARKKYCSVKCQQDLKYRENIEKWLAGELDLSTSMGCSSTVKRFLLEKCGNKCPKCGWGEIHPVTGKVPLEINHIDGDSKNNRPENLEVLCPNCHSLTPNYRALNKKSSRTHRGLRKM